MKKYNFDLGINRRHTNALKWNVDEDVLPMWIGDMDFASCPAVLQAIQERSLHGAYGYTLPDESWYEAYIRFFRERHGFEIQKDWLFFSTGVVPTISSTVRALTSPGEQVVLLTPVYNIFFHSVLNNQRLVRQVPLVYENGGYEIDFAKLEQAFQEEKTTLLIFCNPANPASKIWSKEELEKVGKLAYENHVVVLSDEIHGELVRPGFDYVPFASVNEINQQISIMATSPSKPFNIAGLQSSAVIIPNETLRKKVNRQLNTDECAEPNVFACPSAVAALNDGREWLDELREYLFINRDYATAFIEKNIPQLKPIHGDATYFLWVDISALGNDGQAFSEFLKEKAKLYVSPGNIFGGNGNQFIRINLACPLTTVKEGLKRLAYGVSLFLKQ